MTEYPYADRLTRQRKPLSIGPEPESVRQWIWVLVFVSGLALAGCSFLLGIAVADWLEPDVVTPFSLYDPLGHRDFVEHTTGWVVTVGEAVGGSIAAVAFVGWMASFFVHRRRSG